MMSGNICVRETRVFVPMSPRFALPFPFPNITGYVLRPVAEMSFLQWFWFTWYGQLLSDNDLQDCNPYNFPQHFYWNANNQRLLLSFRFRYSLPRVNLDEFERTAQKIFLQHGCIRSYVRDYQPVDDLGGNRFTDNNTKRERRAVIVTSLVHATAQLVLHALEGPDINGNYTFEVNMLEENAFRVPGHLFCNMTKSCNL